MVQLPSTARGRRTRGRILVAATTLVRERGVAATSLDAVEHAAGVGRSQLYHYFDGRDDLLRAVVATTAATVLDEAVPRLDDLDTMTGIDRWFSAAVALARERGGVGGCPIGSLAGQIVEQDDGARVLLAQAFDRWEAPLLAGLAQMRERGELQTGADERGARRLRHGGTAGWPTARPDPPRPRAARCSPRRRPHDDPRGSTTHLTSPSSGEASCTTVKQRSCRERPPGARWRW